MERDVVIKRYMNIADRVGLRTLLPNGIWGILNIWEQGITVEGFPASVAQVC